MHGQQASEKTARLDVEPGDCFMQWVDVSMRWTELSNCLFPKFSNSRYAGENLMSGYHLMDLSNKSRTLRDATSPPTPLLEGEGRLIRRVGSICTEFICFLHERWVPGCLFQKGLLAATDSSTALGMTGVWRSLCWPSPACARPALVHRFRICA